MIIKKADDKTKRLNLLNELTQSDRLDARQRQWAEEELFRLKRGIEGERDAAYYINSLYKDSKNHVVLHDLRIEVEGDVAQIDHLVMTRTNRVFLFETKCFNGNLEINDHGEFTMTYAGGKRFGIPSPIEQSKRHERVLTKLLEQLDITGRTGTPAFVHTVLLHPKAIIKRPDSKAFNTDNVIKADSIEAWREKWIEKEFGITDAFTALINVRSTDTLQEWGEKLSRQHRPVDVLALPAFMKPRAVDAPPAQSQTVADAKRQVTESAKPDESLKRKLVCVTCHNKITFPEGKFCWSNERRFGGFQYCREHQVAFQ